MERKMSAHAYYRIKAEGKFLKAEDYRFGFGLDTHLLGRINEARIAHNKALSESDKLSARLPLRDDFNEGWDSRTGHSIEGKPLPTRYHPLHDIKLLERETGNIYVIDAVHKHHYFGYYIVLLIRQEGSKSHGIAYWENITCKDPTTLEGIQEAHERFEIIKS